ncbi:L-threonine O-3-phosphate decarboxylase [Desulforamulus reducens MI-1]|uniref:threonine-phosphate decarboxylase n=1 Tax=Desulforamulus reducens (strain ATCC BAA-1160 / DSM 100696 / MI-1) TaxID=349161 RepID=A4J802_DESRM|nr:threonine-phosphate decarboxylase CobD [Desulforamulus reducens]ABO51205.1 L-threonine O-3-phosphate decarboxylase [Desulforamulus reducens MI-1]
MQKHGGNIWLAAETYGLKEEALLDFSANINPLGPSPLALQAMQQALVQIKHYPEPQAETLRKEISLASGLSEEMLILGNGAAELIYALGRIIKPRRVLLPAPTFSEYADAFGEIEQVYIPLDRNNCFTLDIEAVGQQLKPGDLAIVCNPNNPTGQLVSRQHLKSLAARVQAIGADLLVDEAFMDFVSPEQSLLQEIPYNSHLYVLRSLTKFFAIPGLRLGYLATSPDVIETLISVLPPWRVNLMAQAAGVASLRDKQYGARTLEQMNRLRPLLAESLASIPGLRPLSPTANFILVDCRESGYSAKEIQNFLGPKGILIRQCENFVGLDGYFFRVAVRSEEDNERLLQALRELLQKNKRIL